MSNAKTRHQTTQNRPWSRDYDPDIDWLLNEAPALLGERSGQPGVVASIERGASSGGSISDTSPHHDAAIDAASSVQAARRLDAIWQRVAASQQRTLRARYYRRQHWPTGCVALLTPELVGVALLLAEDREALVEACRSAAKPASERVVTAARERAQEAVWRAHEAWDAAKRARTREWVEAGVSA